MKRFFDFKMEWSNFESDVDLDKQNKNRKHSIIFNRSSYGYSAA